MAPTNFLKATSSQSSASYIDFGGGSYFVIAFTLGGTTLTMDPSYSPGWNYYVAGGAGSEGSNPSPPPYGQPYPSGKLLYSNDGSTSRTLANGSFDGWVFGDTNDPATIVGVNPNSADFTDATVINLGSVPEPSRILLLLGGLGMMALRRGRPSMS